MLSKSFIVWILIMIFSIPFIDALMPAQPFFNQTIFGHPPILFIYRKKGVTI